jgi:mannose-6-phosphate isomerase-like protein (cupin superfamily)
MPIEINELSKKYPGKAIITNTKENPTEILCEVEPTNEHGDYSLAVSVIDKSIPHVHKKALEKYKVIKGKLKLYIGDKVIELTEGGECTINPGLVHWAEGNETWVECYAKPGWTQEDHVLSV